MKAWRRLATAGGAALLAGPAYAQADLGHAVDEVVVTASPLGGNPDRFATIVEQVRREDVLSNGGASLADALRTAPGVAGSGFAAGASRPIIRGMDAQRVKLAENGLASSDVSDVGPDHGVPIDPLSAQEIEVVRGAATLRYGSQAIGGVVNVINNRIPRKPISGAQGEANGAYTSVARTGEGSASADLGGGAFAVHLDGFGRHAGDYETPEGRQLNSFFRGTGDSGGASVFLGEGQASRVGAAVSHYQATYGIPSDVTFIRMRQTKGAVGSSLKVVEGALKSVNLDASYADYSHGEIDPATGEVLATFANQEWDGRAEAVLGKIGPLSAAAVGVQGQDRRFSALGSGADYMRPTHTVSGAGFLFVEAPLGPLQAQAAVRAEQTRIEGTPASNVRVRRSFTPVSASLGFTVQPAADLRFGLTATSAARAPAQTELFARGPHDGPQTFETGDPNLKIERANSLEATMRYSFGGEGRIEASLWGAGFQNYIVGQLTGRTCDETGACAVGGPEALRELNYVQRDANFWGAELKAFAPLGHVAGGELAVQALADYVRARFRGGEDVPRIQPGRIGGGLHWETDRLDASFLMMRVGAQSHPGRFDTPTSGYDSLDAQLGWWISKGKPGLQLLLVGHNLTDATIRSATSLNKDLVVMPGRDLRLVLDAKF